MPGHRVAVKRRLRLEQLEQRTPLAGDVTVSVTDGVLTVQGDAEGNTVFIRQLPPEQASGEPWAGVRYQIEGFEIKRGEKTVYNPINGQESVIVEGVKSGVQIDVGLGDDRVVARGRVIDGKNTPANLPGQVSVLMGDGADIADLSIENHSLAQIDAGDDQDEVVLGAAGGCRLSRMTLTAQPTNAVGFAGDEITLRNVVAGGDIDVVGGPGIQTVSILGEFSHYRRQLQVDTGAGGDNVRVQERLNDSFSRTMRINTGDGNDTVQIRASGTVTTERMVASLGRGNDLLELSDFLTNVPPITITGLTIFAGAGDDVIRSVAPSNNHHRFLNDASIRSGTGNDAVVLTALNVGSTMTIDTSDGDDSIRIERFESPQFSATMGSEIDRFIASNGIVVDLLEAEGGEGAEDRWETYEPETQEIGLLDRSGFEIIVGES